MAISMPFFPLRNPFSRVLPPSCLQSRIRVRSGLVMRSSHGESVRENARIEGRESNGLELLYDGGYGTHSVIDYLDAATEMIRPDGGPPRWFCPVSCGRPMNGSPLLLFLPGMDGIGLGLILHHKALGKVFEVRCLHIPICDRTSFEGLLEFIEETVKLEHAASPNKPIYLVGDSFGGCLALSIAARNPSIDLLLILSNPARSFDKSCFRPWLPIVEAFPDQLHVMASYLLSFVVGDPIKMGMASVDSGLSPLETLDQLSRNLFSLVPRLVGGFADILPKETLTWKLGQLKSAASYANSHLHAVKAEVLVLASGKDNMLPSRHEAERLWNTLQNCKVRYFKDHGHALLLVGTNMYRRSRRYDSLSDYLPPTITELKVGNEKNRWFNLGTSPVMFSTLKDGKIVRSLAGIPNEGPVILVGYHMLMGLELAPLSEAFLREKNVLVRGIAHPIIFSEKAESPLQEMFPLDFTKLFGALPVSASNIYRLLSSRSFVLLYPGGAREALHWKVCPFISLGEEYMLFWPDQPEFVRMAAQFGATIVPFGAVGEDDMLQLVLDYNEQMSIPFMRDSIKESNKGITRLRTDVKGEIGNQDLHTPWIVPKIPGRLYYLFGKPIKTRERMEEMRDKEKANAVYLQIKTEIESMISYLKKKREEDPYRGILQRAIYHALCGSNHQVPTFEP
ncbi:phytyl ester synthase 1, chloroplastic-like isoform X3 [Magnolia sinica]|uniref:phytyl ester synthase 1, chloroplastic-like isoform X3 n=1 Tax=Magnolia sinica TaxID=86752 RepID=UPI00265A18DA|nr:phytyl ester synthase 1, chloroplastic-like isoform X3 [Magnolia sinica]